MLVCSVKSKLECELGGRRVRKKKERTREQKTWEKVIKNRRYCDINYKRVKVVGTGIGVERKGEEVGLGQQMSQGN